MRFTDIFSMAFLTIRRQRGRTALSLVGIVIGALILIFSVAARKGVNDAIQRVFSLNDQLRRIQVWPDYGVIEEDIPAEELEITTEMDDEKRVRIRRMLIRQWQSSGRQKYTALTRERLREIQGIDNVAQVLPIVNMSCWTMFDSQEHRADLTGAPPDNKSVRDRIVAGEMFDKNDGRGILIHEFLAYLWGAVDQEELQKLVGKTIRLEQRQREEAVAQTLTFHSGNQNMLTQEEVGALNRALDRIPAIVEELPLSEEEKAALAKAFQTPKKDEQLPAPRVITEEYLIQGVFRSPTEEEQEASRFRNLYDDVMLVLPIQTATNFYFRAPRAAEVGVYNATVIVDHEENLKSVTQKLRDMGLDQGSLIDLVENIQQQVTTATWIFAALSAIPLLVAGMGIMNTMIISVVERTHEIGVMKSVGARDRHVLLIFLVEGALLGILGAAAALLLGWLLMFPIDYSVRMSLESEIGKPFDQYRVIVFPLWLTVAVPLFCGVLTMVAAIIPARRAARLNPVTALRHE